MKPKIPTPRPLEGLEEAEPQRLKNPQQESMAQREADRRERKRQRSKAYEKKNKAKRAEYYRARMAEIRKYPEKLKRIHEIQKACVKRKREAVQGDPYPQDPVKSEARRRLRQKVRSGKIVRMPCEICGKINAEAHHEDYSKPFDVRWLCRPHHNALHKGHISLLKITTLSKTIP